jgi:hypothetical protein
MRERARELTEQLQAPPQAGTAELHLIPASPEAA